MRKSYWRMTWMAILVVSLGSGCTVLKPAKTIVQDAEALQIFEDQTDSPAFETENGKNTGNDLENSTNGGPDPTEANGLTDGAPDQEAGTAISSSESTSMTSSAARTNVDVSGPKETDSAGTAKASASTPSLITKSENAVTETERVELLNTLGFELDELIRLLDSLDTVQESDLNLDEFEE